MGCQTAPLSLLFVAVLLASPLGGRTTPHQPPPLFSHVTVNATGYDQPANAHPVTPQPQPQSSPTGGVVSSCTDAALTLSLHNSYRALHDAPPLAWSTTLAAKAQQWATHLTQQNGCWLTHSTSQYGENLYMHAGSAQQVNGQCATATTAWYNEGRLYKYTSTPWSSNLGQFEAIGHFTQLVWRSSTAVGCAVSMGMFEGTFKCAVVACEYTGPGNVGTNSAFLTNVFPVTP